MAELGERVFAAAAVDVSTVGETIMRAALGDEGWEGLPGPAKQMFTDNGPAIVGEFRGGFLDVGAEELGTIVQPTLLVGANGSPPVFAEATDLLARHIPSARVEWVEGGHLIDPAHPAVLRFVDDVLARRSP